MPHNSLGDILNCSAKLTSAKAFRMIKEKLAKNFPGLFYKGHVKAPDRLAILQVISPYFWALQDVSCSTEFFFSKAMFSHKYCLSAPQPKEIHQLGKGLCVPSLKRKFDKKTNSHGKIGARSWSLEL